MTPRFLSAAVALAFAFLMGACGSKYAPVAPAVLPSDGAGSGLYGRAPEATLTVEPERIIAGETAILTWTSTGADTAWLQPGPGKVEPNGRLEIRPDRDTSYSLTVQGDGGETTASARVFVMPSDPLGGAGRNNGGVQSADLLPPFSEAVRTMLQDIYFDYDADALDSDQQRALDANALVLMDLFEEYPTGRVMIEGHCDERGSSEYNLALGDRRSRTAYDYLVARGVPQSRLQTVSMGKEKPQCFEQAESCWSQNRRAHFEPLTR